MEQDDFVRHQLIGQCRDIITVTHSYYEKFLPGSIKEMTALDQELSAAPLAVRINGASLENRRKLRLSKSMLISIAEVVVFYRSRGWRPLLETSD